eukprot:s10251_g1.t1
MDSVRVMAEAELQLPFLSHVWQCAQTPLERRGDFFPGWAVELNTFAPGDVVFLDTGSTARHHHAVVVSRPEESGVICPALRHDELVAGLSRRTSFPQDCEVALQIDGLLVHVPCRRLVRVLPPPRVLVVHDTFSYRRLARTQAGQDDGVLELGSSLGEPRPQQQKLQLV